MREGFKDFGGKIIGGVLLFLAVKYFPILKKLFRRKDDPEGGSQTLLEIQNSVATIHEKLETYHQEKEDLKEELEQQKKALKQAESEKDKAANRADEIKEQLEAKVNEEEIKQA
ncbi:MAG: hypothetical protein IJU07_10085, partial [Synergistaceae bacterium]|nr:hypothetical protein [Synergistaceae bacterium]